MQIKIIDDFDLVKIATSGQCFRVKVFADGTYRFITANNIVYIKKVADKIYNVSCNEGEWADIWWDYFDLGRDYKCLRKKEKGKHAFVDKAIDAGCGLRILRQDPWEMLITFIISQRKSIPSISKAVEELARRYGQQVTTSYETTWFFPSVHELSTITVQELQDCALGYRAAYVYDAIHRVSCGMLDLDAISELDDVSLLQMLMSIHGVGTKVANCVCLFGYGRVACAPIDIWINRAIERECDKTDPFPLFPTNAGIIQQYIFYYMKSHQSA